MNRKFVLFTALCFLTFLGHSQIKVQNLRADVQFLSSDEMQGRLTGTVFQDIAAQYIASRFTQIGLKPAGDSKKFFQTFYYKPVHDPHAAVPAHAEKVDSLKVINVVGMIDNRAAKTIIIGAHYDHLGHGENGFSLSSEKGIHNGADDNASGVSIMINLAEALSKSSSKYNYLFIAFSGEEYGLWGSSYFVKNPTIDLKNAAAMINLDMVGRLRDDGSLLIGGVGTSPIWPKLLENSNVSKIKLTFEQSGSGPSDHTSFYFKDIPVLFFFTGQHGDYHKPSDDIEKINFSGMQMISENIYTLLQLLNKESSIPFTKTVDPKKEENITMKVTLGIMPDYMYNDGGLRIDGVNKDRPGSKAGLMAGDIILQLGKFEIKDIQDYMKALNGINPGEKVNIEYKRADKIHKGSVQF